MEPLSSGNMQVPGHVRLHQVTGHKQLLKQFTCLAHSSCGKQQQRSQQFQRPVIRRHVSMLVNLPALTSTTACCSSCRPSIINTQRRQRRAIIQAAAAGLVDVISIDAASSSDVSSQPAVQQAASPAVGSQSSSRVVSILANRLQAQPSSKQSDPTYLDSMQSQQQLRQPAVFDPSALPIADRVKLLRNRIAARSIRRKAPPFRTGSMEAGSGVLSVCTAAGVDGTAATYIMNHVLAARIKGQADVLSDFVSNYKQLADTYGSTAALQWLRRVPSIVRNAQEVPGRLAQLQYLLGRGQMRLAELSDVLELTRRCPQVLGVDAALMVPRARAICDLLGRPHDAACDIITAAPALLGMSRRNLESKVKQLKALAAANPYWAAAYGKSTNGSLAVLLTYSIQRYSRLQYMKERRPHERLCISTVMAMAEKTMAEKYADYADWKQQQQQAGTAGGQQQQQSMFELSGTAEVVQQQQQAREARAAVMKEKWQQDYGSDAAEMLPRAQAICHLLGRSYDEAHEIMVSTPALLGVEHSKLEIKAQQLRSMAAANPYWTAAYDKMSAGSLATLLTYSSNRYSRLQYMQERQPNSRFSLSTVMAMSEKAMMEKFPDFRPWQEQQLTQQSQQQLASDLINVAEQQQAEQLLRLSLV